MFAMWCLFVGTVHMQNTVKFYANSSVWCVLQVLTESKPLLSTPAGSSSGVTHKKERLKSLDCFRG